VGDQPDSLVLLLASGIRPGPTRYTGSLDAYGYGRLYSGNKEVKAHRAFYEAFEGPLPDGKYLQHHLRPASASGMPAAILTISSSTIRQGVGFHAERKTVPRRPSSGPVCNAEWKRKAGKRQQMRCKVLRFRPTSGLEVPWSIPLLSRLWMRFAFLRLR